MRLPCLLFVAVAGCAQVVPCPRCVTCAAPAPPLPVVPAAVEPKEEASDAVVTPIEPREAALVVGTLFPKHLKNLRDCKKGRQPNTWVEVDDVALRNLDRGQFVPVVESREVITTSEGEQIRFSIRLDNCETSDDETLHVEAVFREWSLDPDGGLGQGRRPRPVLLREW